MVTALGWLRSHVLTKLPYPDQSFAGQTVVVTGSNVGLGLEAARHFVRLDAAKVILAVRSAERGEAARRDIKGTEGKAGVVEVWQLDLGSYDSVRQFASRAQGLERLDVVVENAAIYTFTFGLLEGSESTITVNVISTFLLALLLLPKLRETAVKFDVIPRLVVVASFVHFLTKFPAAKSERIFDALNDEKQAEMNDRYNVSKLIEIYVVRELAGLLDGSDKPGRVVLNCLNPGFCRTAIMREASGLQKAFIDFAKVPFSRSAEVGSRTLVAAAAAGVESHGQYLDDCRVGQVHGNVSGAQGQATQKRVWAELAAKLEEIQPGVLQNV
ncbi:MAG: hypothetical protein M1832_004531 [Thelocarpon impressellum]|nr:MAG: hypothetical protein M1832_004531 [Thelocarpon impressellum]